MELINLNEASRHKFLPAVNKAGGKFSFSEKLKIKGSGIAGITYRTGLSGVNFENVYDKPVHVTVEKYRQGLGIYFRNSDLNQALVIGHHEIKSISISKDLDSILPPSNVFYKVGSRFTSDYLTWRNLLIDAEKIEFHPILLTIDFHISSPVELEISGFRPNKVIQFVKSIQDLVIIDRMEGFIIIP